MSSDRPLESLTADDFRPFEGAPFEVTGAEHPAVAAELVEVTDLASTAPDGVRAPFSVVFSGPSEPVLPQGIHTVEHEQLGTLELFLVPIGPGEEGMRYEAVFG